MNQDLTSVERRFYLVGSPLYHLMDLPHRNHRFVVRLASVWFVIWSATLAVHVIDDVCKYYRSQKHTSQVLQWNSLMHRN